MMAGEKRVAVKLSADELRLLETAADMMMSALAGVMSHVVSSDVRLAHIKEVQFLEQARRRCKAARDSLG